VGGERLAELILPAAETGIEYGDFYAFAAEPGLVPAVGPELRDVAAGNRNCCRCRSFRERVRKQWGDAETDENADGDEPVHGRRFQVCGHWLRSEQSGANGRLYVQLYHETH